MYNVFIIFGEIFWISKTEEEQQTGKLALAKRVKKTVEDEIEGCYPLERNTLPHSHTLSPILVSHFL